MSSWLGGPRAAAMVGSAVATISLCLFALGPSASPLAPPRALAAAAANPQRDEVAPAAEPAATASPGALSEVVGAAARGEVSAAGAVAEPAPAPHRIPSRGLHDRPNASDDVAPRPSTVSGPIDTATALTTEVTKKVWCLCKDGHGGVQCGAMQYTLLQCHPACGSVCRNRGMQRYGCGNERDVRYFRRVHIMFTDCGDSPLH
mmetsp:Transcript_70629/g.204791  ORF Transcript_70629/g.204791 Transcript_70629/m.204791 type:complete len:203 (-) Transcript_70629:178-786(-)